MAGSTQHAAGNEQSSQRASKHDAADSATQPGSDLVPPRIDIHDLIETVKAIRVLVRPYQVAGAAAVNLLCWDNIRLSAFAFAVIVWGLLVSPAILSSTFAFSVAIGIAFSWMIPIKDVHSELIEFDELSQAVVDAYDWDSEVEMNSESQKQLTEFTELLSFLQEVLAIVFSSLLYLERLRRWVDPYMSLKFLLVWVGLGSLLLMVPLNLILCCGTTFVFSSMRNRRDQWQRREFSPQTRNEQLDSMAPDSHRIKSSDAWVYIARNDNDLGHKSDDRVMVQPETVAASKVQRPSNDQGRCTECSLKFNPLFRKRVYCRACGDSFCSTCCSSKVPRFVFGATSPAARKQTVRVCRACKRTFEETGMEQRLSHEMTTKTDDTENELLI